MADDVRTDPRRAFYDQHLPFVLQVARAMLRDEDDVREVVQNVFLDVRWSAPEGVRDTRQWVREVTRNHCCRQWRQRYRAASLGQRLTAWYRAAPPSAEAPARALDQRRLRDDFLRAFYALDDEEQRVIQMRHLDPELSRESPDEERTLDEIAALLGWNKIRVRRRLDSARKKLSVWLDVEPRTLGAE